jgi:hypothetical protein
MFLTRWRRRLKRLGYLSRSFGSSRPSVRPAPAARCQPLLEILEDRLVPATIVVKTTEDGVAGSLRSAILRADASKGNDTIVLPAGFYALTQSWATLADSSAVALAITANLTIQGAGAGATRPLNTAAPPRARLADTVQLERLTTPPALAMAPARPPPPSSPTIVPEAPIA